MTLSTMRQLAYIESTKEFVVICSTDSKRLADRVRDPFEDHPQVYDFEEELEKRLEATTKKKERKQLEELLHLVHTYNESHARFERLKYLKDLQKFGH
jgi:predicted nucleotidyltransferase